MLFSNSVDNINLYEDYLPYNAERCVRNTYKVSVYLSRLKNIFKKIRINKTNSNNCINTIE